MAGLAGLRDALKEEKNVVIVAVNETPGATKETSTAAATTHKLDGIPILIDEKNATGKALGGETDNTISYVVIKADGTKKVLASAGSVRKFLKE